MPNFPGIFEYNWTIPFVFIWIVILSPFELTVFIYKFIVGLNPVYKISTSVLDGTDSTIISIFKIPIPDFKYAYE